jgi:hypothetical protein
VRAGGGPRRAAWLGRAWDQRSTWLVFVRSYAEFAPLQADPPAGRVAEPHGHEVMTASPVRREPEANGG